MSKRFERTVLSPHEIMAGATGLEPAASCVTGRRSNQLNYAPALKTHSLLLPRIPPAARQFPKLPENAATGQRSNQLNYVPSLFSYCYWKPAYLLALLTFNRFACIAVEPNSEVNGHHRHHAERATKTVLQANTNPEQLSYPVNEL
jgi:hypothetical protein